MADVKVSGLAAATDLDADDLIYAVEDGVSVKATFTQVFTDAFPAVGQLAFPASQSASADANTLDDYEEGTWTPVLTFATPGNLSVTYGTQLGYYTKIGRLVTVMFSVSTSAFTHTTASGALRLTGLPFTPDGNVDHQGVGAWGGITKANYTQVNPRAGGGTTIVQFQASGSGQAVSLVTATDVPTGGTVTLFGTVSFFV